MRVTFHQPWHNGQIGGVDDPRSGRYWDARHRTKCFNSATANNDRAVLNDLSSSAGAVDSDQPGIAKYHYAFAPAPRYGEADACQPNASPIADPIAEELIRPAIKQGLIVNPAGKQRTALTDPSSRNDVLNARVDRNTHRLRCSGGQWY